MQDSYDLVWQDLKTWHTKEVEWVDFADGNVYNGGASDKKLYVGCVRSNK